MLPSNAQASTTKKTFEMECSVGVNIKAQPQKIWSLLTNAENFPKWNSTVISIEGNIGPGQKLKLKSTSNPKRVFPLTVAEFEPASKMVWSDGNFMFKGVRTYTLSAQSNGSTDFIMTEVFSGLMLPMIAGSLPDFKPYFEQFANDLKKAAEAV